MLTMFTRKIKPAYPLSYKLCQTLHSSRKTSLPEEKLTKASLSDRDAVLAIDRNVYSGLDRLPYTYAELIKAPNTGYVYKKGEKTVGFTAAQLTDDGQSVFFSAVRVSPEFRGDGTFSRFKKQAFRDYRHTHHGLRYLTAVVNSTLRMGEMMRSFRVVEEKKTVCYEMDLPRARRNLPNLTLSLPNDVKQLSRNDISMMMTCPPDLMTQLFPNGRIILSFVPCRVMTANTDLIFGGKRRQLLTSFGEQNEKENRFFESRNSKVGEFPKNENAVPDIQNERTGVFLKRENTFFSPIIPISDEQSGKGNPGNSSGVGSLLSSITYCPCDFGIVCELDLYGTGSEDQLRAHFARHFLFLLENSTAGKAFIQVESCVGNVTAKPILSDMAHDFSLSTARLYPEQNDLVLEANYDEIIERFCRQ